MQVMASSSDLCNSFKYQHYQHHISLHSLSFFLSFSAERHQSERSVSPCINNRMNIMVLIQYQCLLFHTIRNRRQWNCCTYFPDCVAVNLQRVWLGILIKPCSVPCIIIAHHQRISTASYVSLSGIHSNTITITTQSLVRAIKTLLK